MPRILKNTFSTAVKRDKSPPKVSWDPVELSGFSLGAVPKVRGSEKLGESGRLLCQHGLEQQDFPFFPSSVLKYVMCIIFKQDMVILEIELHVFN